MIFSKAQQDINFEVHWSRRMIRLRVHHITTKSLLLAKTIENILCSSGVPFAETWHSIDFWHAMHWGNKFYPEFVFSKLIGKSNTEVCKVCQMSSVFLWRKSIYGWTLVSCICCPCSKYYVPESVSKSKIHTFVKTMLGLTNSAQKPPQALRSPHLCRERDIPPLPPPPQLLQKEQQASWKHRTPTPVIK